MRRWRRKNRSTGKGLGNRENARKRTRPVKGHAVQTCCVVLLRAVTSQLESRASSNLRCLGPLIRPGQLDPVTTELLGPVESRIRRLQQLLLIDIAALYRCRPNTGGNVDFSGLRADRCIRHAGS